MPDASPSCPQCQAPLCPVTYPSDSFLNEDQWRSLRNGDYYCKHCPPERPLPQRYRYYWAHELQPHRPMESH